MGWIIRRHETMRRIKNDLQIRVPGYKPSRVIATYERRRARSAFQNDICGAGQFNAPARSVHTSNRPFQTFAGHKAGLGLAYSASQESHNVTFGPRTSDYHHVESTPVHLTKTTKNQLTNQESLSCKIETILGQPHVPVYHRGDKFQRFPYWQSIPRWKDIPEDQFMDYRWSTVNDIQGKHKLYDFLKQVLPERLKPSEQASHLQSREAFIQDVMAGIDMAPMSIRLPPHICASIDWTDAINDPLRRQFIPLKSTFEPNHPMLTLDALHETADSPCPGLVHRYPDKCLFLASSHCPLYCRFCTRSYAVGANTETVTKAPLKPQRARWQDMLNYIAKTPSINDVVLSGGDSYSLQPQHLRLICDQLINIEHVRRFRIATKGLCVSPNRIIDPHDTWTDELISISKAARERGKHVAVHTHFNHINEFSWITREACQRLFASGVVVRNQSVLSKGVNDTPALMGTLIRELADNNINPYYVYAGDLVRGVEDLRTPLRTILDLERDLRGTIAGFMTPQYVVDLPGGGGKRLAASYISYDEASGISTFTAPAVKGRGKEDKIYSYYDPLTSLSEEGRSAWLNEVMV